MNVIEHTINNLNSEVKRLESEGYDPHTLEAIRQNFLMYCILGAYAIEGVDYEIR